MKTMIMASSFDQIKQLIEYSDAFILGVKDLSINMPAVYEMDEVVKINTYLKENKKEVFISLNKNMHNSDIPYLKETMVKLKELNIDGIIYYDIAVVNLNDDLDLKMPLVWSQEHMTTNYITSDFWFDHGAKYTLLSSEITLEEIEEIVDNAKSKIIVTLFGYLPMFASRRHLVKNYLTEFNLKDNSNINYIEHKGEYYPIINDKHGTIAYSNYVLNGIKEVPNLKADYMLLNSFLIPESLFKEVVKMFSEVNEENKLLFEKEINDQLKTDYGFLYKETIYKVKKND